MIVKGRQIIKIWLLMVGVSITLLSLVGSASSADPFVYPKDGQSLRHGEGYMVQADLIPGATHYLIEMRQGNAVYENWADNQSWSRELALWSDNPKHGDFQPGEVEISVRGLVNHQWTSKYSIRVTLISPSMLGDVTCDGVINEDDPLEIAAYSVGDRTGVEGCPLSDPTTQINVLACDLSGDGVCNILDAYLTSQCVVGASTCPLSSR